MTDLMRESLSSTISKRDNENKKYSHAGLLIQRGLSKWEDKEKNKKRDLIFDISNIKPSDLYLLAFTRWFLTTYEKPTFEIVSKRIDGRLFTGLALGGTLETGAMTHHTYGMPMIAGSSIKGAVRNYAEYVFAKRLPDGKIDYRVEIDENNKEHYYLQFEEDKQILLGILFGKEDDEDEEDEPNNTKLESGAGYLIWHDAWWIPKVTSNMELSSDNQPFVGEVVTVHHPQYYQGTLPDALDIESPLPNQQIAIQGDFYFCIEGSEKWAKFAKKLLDNMLKEQGLGAKGSNGYGYFTDSKSELLQPFIKHQKQQQAKQKAIEEQAKIQQEISNLSENQKLIYLFKAELNKLPANQWQGKPNITLDIKVNDENLWFSTLFDKVETWSDDDQKYALEQLFLENRKHLSKKLQDRVKVLKNKLGI